MITKLRDLFFTKDFYKGIVFELILFVVAIGTVLWAALQIPLHANGYADQVGTAAFLMMGVVGVVTTLFVRSGSLKIIKGRTQSGEIDEKYAQMTYRIIVLTFALPVLAYLILLPWILSGAFNDESMGTLASAFLLFLLAGIIMPLLGVLAAAFVVFPIESTIRGTVTVIRTRGKEWTQLAIGLFGLMILALIATGTMAVDTRSSGPLGQGQLLVALLGLPGEYSVQNEPLLWVTRLLFIIFIVTLFFVKFITGPHKKNTATKDSSK